MKKSKFKLKKGDEVKVVSGKDKGKTGKIEKVYSKEAKVQVSNVNQYKRHLKKQQQGGGKGEIVTITKPLPVANVALICPKCHKVTRVGFEIEKDLPRRKAGKKVRICRKCKKLI